MLVTSQYLGRRLMVAARPRGGTTEATKKPRITTSIGGPGDGRTSEECYVSLSVCLSVWSVCCNTRSRDRHLKTRAISSPPAILPYPERGDPAARSPPPTAPQPTTLEPRGTAGHPSVVGAPTTGVHGPATPGPVVVVATLGGTLTTFRAEEAAGVAALVWVVTSTINTVYSHVKLVIKMVDS